jgi:alkylation response protein AidB-like acyl-CoA dehydrogenase
MTTSTHEHLILETVERICTTEICKYQNEAHYNTVPKALYEALSEGGLAGISIPESFGGIDASASTTAAIFETIARFDVGPAIFLSVHAMVSGLITRYGSDAQKKNTLPRLASGEFLAGFALTEPQAGSDARALSTEAIRCQGGFKLKGNKCYITSAGFADLYLVFARTQAESSSEISAFLVPRTTPGLSIGKPERKMGAELSPIASLFFEDAFIPDDALLGPIHKGFTIATSGLASGRVNIAACANGLSRTALDIAVKHLHERRQFGQLLADFQGLQFMIADMYQKLEASRLLTQRAAADIDITREAPPSNINTKLSSSVAKCFATDTAMAITTDAVQLLGGAGYIKDYTVERLMRDAKMLQIVEGANQVQRVIIAREVLAR